MKFVYWFLIFFALIFIGVIAYKWFLKDLPLSVWKWLGFMAIMLICFIIYKIVKGWFFKIYKY